jgi:hypothetical protein
MTVKLVLNSRTVRCIQDNLGADRVTILEDNYEGGRGDKYIQFEVETWVDVLHLIHAGQDSGLELGLYGIKGDPKKAA